MRKVFVPEKDALGYILYLPDNLDTAEFPLLVYLHGAGERGTKLENLYRHAIPRLIEEGREYEAIVLCPQCPAYAVWDNVTVRLKYTIDQVIQEIGVKKDRILCTGSSMGGFGTFMMALSYRSFFAGIALVAGGGMSWRVDNLRTTPIYAAHGDQDDAVPMEYSLMMINEMRKRGMQANLMILKGYGHNDAIEKVYENGEIVNWLLQQRRTDFSYIPETAENLF